MLSREICRVVYESIYTEGNEEDFEWYCARAIFTWRLGKGGAVFYAGTGKCQTTVYADIGGKTGYIPRRKMKVLLVWFRQLGFTHFAVDIENEIRLEKYWRKIGLEKVDKITMAIRLI